MLKIETDAGVIVRFPTPIVPVAFTRVDAQLAIWQALVAIDQPKIVLPPTGGGPIVVSTPGGRATITTDDEALEVHLCNLLRRALVTEC